MLIIMCSTKTIRNGRELGIECPALYFFCLSYQLLNDAQKGTKEHRNSAPPGPLVFPTVPLCFPTPLFVPLSTSSKAVSCGINLIWKDNSFVIISRKGDLVHLFCEHFVMMTPNHIHRFQLLSS